MKHPKRPSRPNERAAAKLRKELAEYAYDETWDPYCQQDWQMIWSEHHDYAPAVRWYAEFAADPECPNRMPMLDLLYFATGDVSLATTNGYEHEMPALRGEIEQLIAQYEATQEFGLELQRWAWRADELLNHQRPFDYDYWCDSGFQWEA